MSIRDMVMCEPGDPVGATGGRIVGNRSCEMKQPRTYCGIQPTGIVGGQGLAAVSERA